VAPELTNGRRPTWIEATLVIGSLFLGAAVLSGVMFFNVLDYSDGVSNGRVPFWVYLGCLLFPIPLWLTLVVYSLLLGHGRPRLRIAGLSLAAFLLVSCVILAPRRHPFGAFEAGFGKWVVKHVDAQSLRQWSTSRRLQPVLSSAKQQPVLMNEEFPAGMTIDRSLWPAELATTFPTNVWVLSDMGGIVIEWRQGSMFAWGRVVFVGTNDAANGPPTAMRAHYLSWRQVAPGLWSGISMGPL